MGKAIALLALRVTTGALLVIWGSIKLLTPEGAIGVSDTYYGGLLSAEALQAPLGLAQVTLGGFVILGLVRRVAYPLQAAVLVAGAAAIWQHILDPLGLYLVDEENRRTLFFPSSTVAVASILMLLYRDDDALALDRIFFRA